MSRLGILYVALGGFSMSRLGILYVALGGLYPSICA